MSRLRANCFAISADGFGAGPDQSLDNPLGKGGTGLHGWFNPTRTFQKEVLGKAGGETGPDDDFAARGMANLGAWILGRNMFTPARGAWDMDWKGWWGGTTFHFVTGGAHEALRLAKAAAGGKDIRVGGGAATIRQYLQDKLIDEMHLVLSPVLLGSGEPLLQGIDLVKLGYHCSEHVTTPKAMHVVITKA
jgi:dihydrofolate reductase